ncbi:MAG: hypothetical protein ABSA21_12670 [Candidatus Limnocylindrales bacterium]|jgi:hypothetical protein
MDDKPLDQLMPESEDEIEAAPPRPSRRSLLAAGLSGFIGLVLGSLGHVPGVDAAAGGSLIMGSSNSAGTSNTSLTTDSTGTALLVTQTGAGTALRGSALAVNGIAGFFTSANGSGVSGVTAHKDKYAVYGGNDASTTGAGAAIRANGEQNNGVYATTAGTTTNAVWGVNTSTTGTGVAVAGQISTTGQGAGVLGWSSAPTGGGWGVEGVSESPSGFGVYGYSAYSGGSVGSSVPPIGVIGETDSSIGFAGMFVTAAGNGVSITTPSGKSGLVVGGGLKSAVVATNDGARLLYSEEATSVLFADYGFGRLVDGKATVSIDPVFAETVNLSTPYHVFVQPYGKAAIVVTERSAERFSVEAISGDGNAEFSYRIVATRRAYEGERLGRAPWADDDPNLYPEKASTSPLFKLGRQMVK